MLAFAWRRQGHAGARPASTPWPSCRSSTIGRVSRGVPQPPGSPGCHRGTEGRPRACRAETARDPSPMAPAPRVLEGPPGPARMQPAGANGWPRSGQPVLGLDGPDLLQGLDDDWHIDFESRFQLLANGGGEDRAGAGRTRERGVAAVEQVPTSVQPSDSRRARNSIIGTRLPRPTFTPRSNAETCPSMHTLLRQEAHTCGAALDEPGQAPRARGLLPGGDDPVHHRPAIAWRSLLEVCPGTLVHPEGCKLVRRKAW